MKKNDWIYGICNLISIGMVFCCFSLNTYKFAFDNIKRMELSASKELIKI